MDWQIFVQLASLLVSGVTGFGAVRVLGYLKTWLKLGYRGSQVAVLVLSMFLAVANMVIANEIVPASFDPEALLPLTIAVLSATQMEYNRLKRAGRLT